MSREAILHCLVPVCEKGGLYNLGADLKGSSTSVSLMVETSPPPKIPGKRMFEDTDYQSHEITPPSKRPFPSLSRDIPRNCGVLASKREQECLDFSWTEKSLNLARNEIVISATPLSVLALPAVKFELMKVGDFEVDNVKKNFMGKDKERLDLAEGFGNAKSEDLGKDEDVLPKLSDELADLKVSSQTMKFDSKYPPPKIRKGVTITRSFPPNCGEDHVTFHKEAMDSGKAAGPETNPYRIETEQNNDEPIEDDDHESLIIKIENYDEHPNTEEYTTDARIENYDENPSTKEYTTDARIENYDEDPHTEEYTTDARIENYDKDPNVKEFKDLCIVPYDASKTIDANNGVKQALMLFEDLYTKLYRKYKAQLKGGRFTKQIHTEAAVTLRTEQKWVNMEPNFGHIPGVEVGDKFQFRVQLAVVGLHHEFICGINCVTLNGKKYANSVVDSGRYDNKVLSRDVILYSGQGGNPRVMSLPEKLEDQKLEGGNLALKNSKDANLPVRVIRKIVQGKKKMYTYEGLYKVINFWQEKTRSKKLAFMFEMVRISGQRYGNYLEMNESRTWLGNLEQSRKNVLANDVSQGKEKIPIRIVNTIDDEKPHPFTYITEMKYPSWYGPSEPHGCDCIEGCSDSKPCYCAHLNGGEIPFNEGGSILKARRLIHECGPLCKCPPSCQNRVSQRGPCFQLEVFKTKSKGWGVRSREDIPSGSFICEYIGEVLADKEAEERMNDEYLFDLDDCDGFSIDAALYGNVGRFLNHSCSPNLYAQNVVYDNDDKSLPHIMLFATKKIPAFQELSYDYNYKIDRVCDAKGNIKKKICHCGSRKCTGRMY